MVGIHSYSVKIELDYPTRKNSYLSDKQVFNYIGEVL